MSNRFDEQSQSVETLSMLRTSVVVAIVSLGALTFTGALLVPPEAQAQEENAEKPRKLSSKVQKALKAAQDAMQKDDWATAAAKLEEAKAVEKRTEFDNYQIDEFEAAIAARRDDLPATVAAIERMLASGYMTPEQEAERLGHATRIYSRLENYDKAIEFAKRWQEATGGENLDSRLLLADSYFRKDNYDGSIAEMKKAIEIAQASGQQVKEPWLQILLYSYAPKGDDANVVATLEELVRNFPKKEYWKQLLGTIYASGETDDRVTVNTYRLMRELGVLPAAEDYVELAELANEEGLPAEAAKVMDEGFANKVLEQGKEVERRRGRAAEFRKLAAADRKQVAVDEKEATAAKSGEPDVAVGNAYLSHDQYDKAVTALQRGIQKGNVKRPDEAQISLGRALLKLNRNDEAAKAFQAVPETSKLAHIAELWAIYATKGVGQAGP
jgi:hypothetical protein